MPCSSPEALWLAIDLLMALLPPLWRASARGLRGYAPFELGGADSGRTVDTWWTRRTHDGHNDGHTMHSVDTTFCARPGNE